MATPFTECLLGGMAAAGAAVMTNPAEVVKTRFQLQGEEGLSGHRQPYRNLKQAFLFIVRHEGLSGIQRGLTAGMAYQFVMNGLRFGSYQVMDSAALTRDESGKVSLSRSMLAGGLSGCASAWVGNPLFVVKTRMQAHTSSPHLAVGVQYTYQSFIDGLVKIYQGHGVAGLWKGAHASVVRVAVGSAAQLSVFSMSKQFFALRLTGGEQTHMISFLGSLTSGLFVVSVMHPFDLVCTRMFNQKVSSKGEGTSYAGIIDCARQILRTEGIRGFYSGYWAGYARLAPHTFLCLFFWDELRRLYMYLR